MIILCPVSIPIITSEPTMRLGMSIMPPKLTLHFTITNTNMAAVQTYDMGAALALHNVES